MDPKASALLDVLEVAVANKHLVRELRDALTPAPAAPAVDPVKPAPAAPVATAASAAPASPAAK